MRAATLSFVLVSLALTACVMPEVWKNFALRMSSSGSWSARMRLAADPARRYENT